MFIAEFHNINFESDKIEVKILFITNKFIYYDKYQLNVQIVGFPASLRRRTG